MRASKTILKEIKGDLGSVFKFLSIDSKNYTRFGEAYFSSVKFNSIKGWNKHKEGDCNLVVTAGKIEFLIAQNLSDSSCFESYTLNSEKLSCLYIPKETWFAFKGYGENNLLLNLLSIKHNTKELVKVNFSKKDEVYFS